MQFLYGQKQLEGPQMWTVILNSVCVSLAGLFLVKCLIFFKIPFLKRNLALLTHLLFERARQFAAPRMLTTIIETQPKDSGGSGGKDFAVNSAVHTWVFPKIGVPPNHPF